MESLVDGGLERIQAALREATVGADGHPDLTFLLQSLDGGPASELFIDAAGEDASSRRSQIYRAASMTKAVTSACILLLAEEGKLGVNAPVSRYIPEFEHLEVAAIADESPEIEYCPITTRPLPILTMTVKHLLNHTSGLLYCFSDMLSVRADVDPLKAKLYKHVCDCYRREGVFDLPTDASHTSDALIAALAKCPLVNAPGAGFHYGLGTDVLGVIVERLTGGTLEAFATARIFAPLGMEDTSWLVPAAKLPRLATLRENVKGDLVPVDTSAGSALSDAARLNFAYHPLCSYTTPGTHQSGGGGMCTTIDDYVKFIRSVLAALLGRTSDLELPRILSQYSARLMCTDSLTSIDVKSRDLVKEGWGYGLGFAVLTSPSTAGEFGPPGLCRWAGIFGTEFWIDPTNEIIGVMMSQRYPWDFFDVRTYYRALVYGALKDSSLVKYVTY